jgi:hypothetical protein
MSVVRVIGDICLFLASSFLCRGLRCFLDPQDVVITRVLDMFVTKEHIKGWNLTKSIATMTCLDIFWKSNFTRVEYSKYGAHLKNI